MACPQEGEHSLEHIMASELYPKKNLTSDDKNLQVPFPALCGEAVEFLGRTSDGIIALSNFRVFIRFKDSFVNIPLGLIEFIECRDIFHLHVYCKDARSLRCTFATNEACMEWYKRLSSAMAPPRKLQDFFAFAFHAWCTDTSPGQQDLEACYQLCQPGDAYCYSFGKEVERMGFDLKKAWRICYINEDYQISPTYPKFHLVPAWISDKEVEAVASFRSSRRFMSVVWRNKKNGAVIARSSQPEVGWLGWRSTEDENLLQAIPIACAMNDGQDQGGGEGKSGDLDKSEVVANGHAGGHEDAESQDVDGKRMLIVDARSYAAAVANRAKGGGCECPEYYPNCEIQFMSLANIHTIRKSFQAVRALCGSGSDQMGWLSSLENTKWLHHMTGLMRAAMTVVNAIDKEGRPVLVHCSDGWDRTPQIVALAELLLDPYFRTIEGFQVLVEREWLDFGHKFGDRCGHSIHSDDTNERCPVFLQWLDCVCQLTTQFPCAFEFNEAFLVKLVQHTYSRLFGTFLCNSSQEREEEKVWQQTSSVWTLLKPSNKKFRNHLYSTVGHKVLKPSCHLRHTSLWTTVYMCNSAPMAQTGEDVEVASEETLDGDVKSEQTLLPKTRSCDDIVAALEHTSGMTRRLSDPNIASDPNFLLKSRPDTQQQPSEDPIPTFDERLDMGIDTVKFINKKSELEIESENRGENSVPNGVVDSSTQIAEPGDSEEGDESRTVSEGDFVENGSDTAKELEQETGFGQSINEEEDCDTGDEGKCAPSPNNCDISDCSKAAGTVERQEHSIESSTDTLISEVDVCSVKDSCDKVKEEVRTKLVNGHDHGLDCMQNGDTHSGADPEETKDTSIEEIEKLKTLDKKSSISTSTSDISDSHVNIVKKFQCTNGQFRLDDALLTLQIPNGPLPNLCVKMNGHCDNNVSNPSSKNSNSSMESETSTPMYSRTPSSTNPPTPGADSKSSNPWVCRNLSALGRHLDSDGLTKFSDPAQQRLEQIESEYQRKIDMLEHQLRAAKVALYQYASGCNGHGRYLNENRDEILSLPESTESGEHQSLGAGSTAASDLSWEQVEEKDAKMTLWVPDHAVTHCAGCDMEFWIVRRKHHCRNCGQVFCGECTNHFIPIPQQYLNAPVRVCQRCHGNILTDNPLFLSVDGSTEQQIGNAMAT